MSKAANYLLIFLAITIHVSAQVPTQPTYFLQKCESELGNYTTNSTYENNLKAVLSGLEDQASVFPFYNTSAGTGADKVYGQYYCRGDIGTQLCSNCIKEAAQTVLRNCSRSRAAIMWFEECTLRYENQSVFGIETPRHYSWWSSSDNVSNPEQFSVALEDTIDRLINESAYGKYGFLKFGTGERVVSASETLYCLVQCSPDLNGTQCETCLRSTFDYIPKCCGEWPQWQFVFYPSCQLRYSIVEAFYPILNPPSAPPTPSPSSSPPPALETQPSSVSTNSESPTPPPKAGSTMIRSGESMEFGLVITALAFFMFAGNT